MGNKQKHQPRNLKIKYKRRIQRIKSAATKKALSIEHNNTHKAQEQKQTGNSEKDSVTINQPSSSIANNDNFQQDQNQNGKREKDCASTKKPSLNQEQNQTGNRTRDKYIFIY